MILESVKQLYTKAAEYDCKPRAGDIEIRRFALIIMKRKEKNFTVRFDNYWLGEYEKHNVIIHNRNQYYSRLEYMTSQSVEMGFTFVSCISYANNVFMKIPFRYYICRSILARSFKQIIDEFMHIAQNFNRMSIVSKK
jgi:hypothetical protein